MVGMSNLITQLTTITKPDITDVGGLPSPVLRPILQKIDSAAQLRQIEINSPHLEDDNVEIWKRLIARHFPVLSERHRFAPSNPKSWHKIYAKYQRIDTEAKMAAQEKLKNAFKNIKQDKIDNGSVVVTYDRRTLPGLPRDVKPEFRAKEASKRGGIDQSELRFSGGSRTKTNTPKSLLKRARREAKEISSRNRLNTAPGAGQVRRGQVMKAPLGMVQEKIFNARPATGIRPPAQRSEVVEARRRDQEDREARLRKAKGMNSGTDGAYIADSDLEDDLDIEDDDDHVGLDVEDLEAFFEEPKSSSRAETPVSSSAKGSSFARKMGSSSVAPTMSRQKVPVKSSESPKSLGTTSTSPPPKPTPSSATPSPGLGPMPRKRKAVDVFMKPKPKIQRPS
jgi:elongin-A